MSVRERILTIRLMEKLKAYPEYAGALGIQVMVKQPTTAENKRGE